MSQPDEEVLHAFSRELVVTARRWRTRLNERLKSIGLTEARWAALYWLWQSPEELSQTALADRAGVENPALVRTLDLLCKAGLVERRTCKHDRRAKVVVLTPAAMPIVRQLDRIAAELRAELMSDLTAEELQVALRVMHKLRTKLDAADPDGLLAEQPDGEAAGDRLDRQDQPH
ncbi:MarR family transcriptional regulator [Phenylobacterium sp. LjRoot225]|uniref:MarR family transcriptional regulator n=1 Tax=Phenylobacterium sp. LjRoot225 TaxID=3342285 RepID=UPI003ECCB370